MTRSPVLDDEALEAELRAMLARRATDVRPARPSVPAGLTALAPVRPASRHRWPRPPRPCSSSPAPR